MSRLVADRRAAGPGAAVIGLACTSLVYTATVKNITLSADERLIEAARRRARTEHTTLNEAFRRWLADYAQAEQRLHRLDEVMAGLKGRLQVGRPIGRDERNAR